MAKTKMENPNIDVPCICDDCCLDRAFSRLINEERWKTVISYHGVQGAVDHGNHCKLKSAQKETPDPCDHNSDGELPSPGSGDILGKGDGRAPEHDS